MVQGAGRQAGRQATAWQRRRSGRLRLANKANTKRETVIQQTQGEQCSIAASSAPVGCGQHAAAG
jgi:hypothetical protein